MKKFSKVMAVMLVVIMSIALLASCGPNSNPEKAEESMKDNGYSTTNLSGALSTGSVAVMLGLKGEDVTNIVFGVKTDDEGNTQGMLAIYCKDAATAKSVVSTAQEKIQQIEDKLQIKFEGESNVMRSGAVLYTGTDQGIKDAR